MAVLLAEGADEGGFADAGFAAEHDAMAFPGRHVFVFVVQRSQVFGSFDQFDVHGLQYCGVNLVVFLGNMKKLAIILGCLIGWSVRVCAQTSPMQWPHHKKATIVLTYDDALVVSAGYRCTAA